MNINPNVMHLGILNVPNAHKIRQNYKQFYHIPSYCSCPGTPTAYRVFDDSLLLLKE